MLSEKALTRYANFVGRILLALPKKFDVRFLEPDAEEMGYTIVSETEKTNIFINPKHPLFKYKDKSGYDTRMILGVVVHEVLHSKYTKPQCFKNMVNRFNIQFPNVLHSLWNILEDFTIETRSLADLDLSPMAVYRLENSMKVKLKDREPSKMLNTCIFLTWDKQPPIEEDCPKYLQLHDALIAFTDVGPLPAGSKLDPEVERAFVDIASDYMNAIYESAEKRMEVAYDAYEKVLKWLEADAQNASKMSPSAGRGLGTTQGKNNLPDQSPSEADKEKIDKSPSMVIRRKILKQLSPDGNSGQQGSPQKGDDAQEESSTSTSSGSSKDNSKKDQEGDGKGNSSKADKQEGKDQQDSDGAGKSDKDDSKDGTDKQYSSGGSASDKEDPNSKDTSSGNGNEKDEDNAGNSGSESDDQNNTGNGKGNDQDGDESDESSASSGDQSDDDSEEAFEGEDDESEGDSDDKSDDDGDLDGEEDEEGSDDADGDPADDGNDDGQNCKDDKSDAGNDSNSNSSSGKNGSDSDNYQNDTLVNLDPRNVEGDYVTDLHDLMNDMVKETEDLSDIVPDAPMFNDTGERKTEIDEEQYRDREVEERKYGNKPIHCKNFFVTSVNDDTIQLYETVCSQNADKIAAIKRGLERIITDEENDRLLSKSGHFEVDRYCRKKGTTLELFTKTKEKTKRDSAVLILADVSGSMWGDKISQEKIILCCLAEALHKVGIPFKVITYCDADDGFVKHRHYVNFKSSKADRAALMTIQAEGSNFDGYSIRYALKELLKNKAKNRLMIIISDGQPNPQHPVNNPVLDARDAVIEARRRVKVCGIALGVHESNLKALKTIYYKNDDEDAFLVVRDEQDLVTALPRLIKKEVKKW